MRGELTTARGRFRLAATAPVRNCSGAAGRLLSQSSTLTTVAGRRHHHRLGERRGEFAGADEQRPIAWMRTHGSSSLIRSGSVSRIDGKSSTSRRRGGGCTAGQRNLAILTAERARHRNRLHGMLATQGVRLRVQSSFLARLATLARADGGRLPAEDIARLTLLSALARASRRLAAGPVRATDAGRRRGDACGSADAAARAGRRGHGAVGGRAPDRLFARGLRDRREIGALSG